MESATVFKKDFDAAAIFVMKVYNADVSVIWNHFAHPEFLDQWWAPKPWRCETQKLVFKEGGKWNYAMIGPENETQYAGAEYHEITLHRSFDRTDFFTDCDGAIDANFPSVKWLLGFTGVEGGTKLTVNIYFNTEGDLKKMLDLGFEEGLKTSLAQLEELLQ